MKKVSRKKPGRKKPKSAKPKSAKPATCEHNDDQGFPDCSKKATFVHPDRDGDFYYCALHVEACPLCKPMR